MKVYVSKKPKNCFECPCFSNMECCCNLDDGTNDYFLDEIDGGECPLQSIKELKQPSEVCSLISAIRHFEKGRASILLQIDKTKGIENLRYREKLIQYDSEQIKKIFEKAKTVSKAIGFETFNPGV